MDIKLAVIHGDGIGVEIIDAALRVLNAVAKKRKHNIQYEYVCAGGRAIDKYGAPLPDEELNKCLKSDSVFGSGGRPEMGYLTRAFETRKGAFGSEKGAGSFREYQARQAFAHIKERLSLKKGDCG